MDVDDGCARVGCAEACVGDLHRCDGQMRRLFRSRQITGNCTSDDDLVARRTHRVLS